MIDLLAGLLFAITGTFLVCTVVIIGVNFFIEFTSALVDLVFWLFRPRN